MGLFVPTKLKSKRVGVDGASKVVLKYFEPVRGFLELVDLLTDLEKLRFLGACRGDEIDLVRARRCGIDCFGMIDTEALEGLAVPVIGVDFMTNCDGDGIL
jgi:hypothetical protein